mgnify:CR=1 FL=1
MSWWNAVGFASNIFGIGSSARGQRRAYQQAKKESPSEIKYRERLEKAKEFGDPELYKKQIESFRPIVSQGERAIASTTGTAIITKNTKIKQS